MTTTSDAERAGLETLRELADAQAVAKAEQLVAEGRGVWVHDPEVEGVVGLVHPDDLKRAWVVVYVKMQDFECAMEFENEVYS